VSPHWRRFWSAGQAKRGPALARVGGRAQPKRRRRCALPAHSIATGIVRLATPRTYPKTTCGFWFLAGVQRGAASANFSDTP
jgi:hypothetical protein